MAEAQTLPDWLDVSRETRDGLRNFAELVAQWTTKINLISASTLPDLWERHILDSAQLYDLAGMASTWADLGSGGGFPAMVLGVIAREKAPEAQFNFVESDQRKCAFLRKASSTLAVKAAVHATRAEALPPLAAQIVTARAMAPLADLLTHVHRHLAPGGRAILPKGAKALQEVEEAQKTWTFDLDVQPSRTDSNARILIIENLRHV